MEDSRLQFVRPSSLSLSDYSGVEALYLGVTKAEVFFGIMGAKMWIMNVEDTDD